MDILHARKIFEQLSTTHICDVKEDVRILDNTIRPFTQRPKMLGKAFTVKADGDLLPILKSLELATAEHIVVIDSKSSNLAVAGEMFASEAKRKGIKGIVIDGYCRDAESIFKIGLPFYAVGTHPKAGSKKLLGQINQKIKCGKVSIFPDEIIIGDENGVLVIDETELEGVLQSALKIAKKEEIAISRMNKGNSLLDMFNFNDHYNNIAAGKSSSFKWLID